MRILLALCAATFLALAFAGCDSAPANKSAKTESAAPEKKEPALYTAKECFPRMSDQALRWASDAQPFHVESGVNQEANGQGGKATVWRASFVSMSRQKLRTFTCSGSRLRDEAAFGVSSSAEMTITPNAAAQMFDRQSLVVDSDSAFARAQEHGGAALVKKNSSQEVLFALDKEPRDKQLVWYVMYGTPPDTKGIGVVDATSGKYLRAR
jgi:hypothetical protein